MRPCSGRPSLRRLGLGFQFVQPLLNGGQFLLHVFSLIPQHAGLILRVHVVRTVGRGVSGSPHGVKSRPSQASSRPAAHTKGWTKSSSRAAATAHTPTTSTTVTKPSVVGRAVTRIGGVAVSSSSSGHRTGTHGPCSIKSWHNKHLPFSTIRRANRGHVVLFLEGAFRSDLPRFGGFCP